MKYAAWKPLATDIDTQRQVLYKWPFMRAVADGRHSFERGRRTTVTAAVWDQLRLGPTAEQFAFLTSS